MRSDESGPTRLTIGKIEKSQEGRVEVYMVEAVVPPELFWFSGHFDGHPVLPAVVQLHEVLWLAVTIWPDLTGLRRIIRAKFHKPILPSNRLSVHLARLPGDRTMTFNYQRSGICCSSGILEFDGVGVDGR